jgi:TolB-like protein/DNA-binding winged helix-turn-helix (wHTH) protein/tetratricopeptide (TPR) repeat protein
MSLPTQGPRGVRLGNFRLDLRTGELWHGRSRVRLQEKPFRILAALIERRGDVVTREELRQQLWPSHTFVDFDHSLNNAVNRLRETLHDSFESPRFIETLPKLGYRFIAVVESLDKEEDAQAAPERDAPSRAASQRRMRLWAAGAGIVLSLLVIAAGVWWRAQLPRVPARRVMLAVLPVQNMSGNPELEYVCDGLTEEMISQLGRWNPEEMGVIARTSSMLYKESRKSVKEVGEELGVDYVVEGSLRGSTDRLRISAQLIRVRDQTHLWAEEFNRPHGDILGLEESVARAVSRQIEVKLASAKAGPRARVVLVSAEAHEAYLRARLLWYGRTPEGMSKSVHYFERAIQLEPEYALAYAGLADAYTVLSSYAILPPWEARGPAMTAARKAVQLDDGSAEAHTALASAYDEFDWNFQAAEREYKRAIELNPNYTQARDWYAMLLVRMGLFEAAVTEIRHALELDPVSLLLNARLCGALAHTDPDAAITQCKRAQELDPRHPTTSLNLTAAYYEKGMKAETLAEARRLVDLSDDISGHKAWLGFYLGWAGREAEAREILNELLERSKREWVSAYAVAAVYSGLGERDAAFQWLEKAYKARESWLTYMKSDVRMDPLRSDPRYADLLRRIGLPLP